MYFSSEKYFQYFRIIVITSLKPASRGGESVCLCVCSRSVTASIFYFLVETILKVFPGWSFGHSLGAEPSSSLFLLLLFKKTFSKFVGFSIQKKYLALASLVPFASSVPFLQFLVNSKFAMKACRVFQESSRSPCLRFPAYQISGKSQF